MGVHCSGGLSPIIFLKFEALTCHFLHSEHYIYSLNLPHSTYWSLNTFAYSESNRFNIISSIHNSNMEYLQGGNENFKTIFPTALFGNMKIVF